MRKLLTGLAFALLLAPGAAVAGDEPAPAPARPAEPAPAPEDARETQAKTLTAKLCGILLATDEAGFKAILHSDAPSDAMRYWWGSSGKGKDFARLYAKCEFAYLKKDESDDAKLRIFAKRFVKKVDRFTDPAPIEFRRDPAAGNDWRLVKFSL